jgi:hypothetical protein
MLNLKSYREAAPHPFYLLLLTLIIQKKLLAPASAKKSVKKFLIKGLIIG